jgi:hypothetical protein
MKVIRKVAAWQKLRAALDERGKGRWCKGWWQGMVARDGGKGRKEVPRERRDEQLSVAKSCFTGKVGSRASPPPLTDASWTRVPSDA